MKLINKLKTVAFVFLTSIYAPQSYAHDIDDWIRDYVTKGGSKELGVRPREQSIAKRLEKLEQFADWFDKEIKYWQLYPAANRAWDEANLSVDQAAYQGHLAVYLEADNAAYQAGEAAKKAADCAHLAAVREVSKAIDRAADLAVYQAAKSSVELSEDQAKVAIWQKLLDAIKQYRDDLKTTK